jgi:putative photosynthetic complex assembly protein 2
LGYGLAILFALIAWWFSTGAILYLIGMPRQTFAVSTLAATAVAGMAVFGLWALSDTATTAGAFVGFSCGLVIWGWHEMSFLMGLVTGPRTEPCPPSAAGWRRLVLATETLIYHELAILATAVLVLAITWGEPNQIGAWTFVILWLARLSAKLNIFLGVPNVTEEFLPTHLEFLKSYFRRRPMNLLFPLSITALTAATILLAQIVVDAKVHGFWTSGATLLATLSALALIEHWFLVLPLPVAALWKWGFKSRETDDPKITAPPRRANTPSAIVAAYPRSVTKTA